MLTIYLLYLDWLRACDVTVPTVDAVHDMRDVWTSIVPGFNRIAHTYTYAAHMLPVVTDVQSAPTEHLRSRAGPDGAVVRTDETATQEMP